MEHVGSLRHARDEIAVGDHYWRICRVGIGKELDGGSIGIVGCPELDGIIGVLGRDAISVGDLLKSANIGRRGKSRIVVADESIERMYAHHSPPPIFISAAIRFEIYMYA